MSLIEGILEEALQRYKTDLREPKAKVIDSCLTVSICPSFRLPEDFIEVLQKKGFDTKSLELCRDQIFKTQTEPAVKLACLRTGWLTKKEGESNLTEVLAGAKEHGLELFSLDLAVQTRLQFNESWGDAFYLGMKPVLINANEEKEVQCILRLGCDDARRWIKLINVSNAKFQAGDWWLFVL